MLSHFTGYPMYGGAAKDCSVLQVCGGEVSSQIQNAAHCAVYSFQNHDTVCQMPRKLTAFVFCLTTTTALGLSLTKCRLVKINLKI